jgi:hypothetical protein
MAGLALASVSGTDLASAPEVGLALDGGSDRLLGNLYAHLMVVESSASPAAVWLLVLDKV